MTAKRSIQILTMVAAAGAAWAFIVSDDERFERAERVADQFFDHVPVLEQLERVLAS